MPLVRVRTFVVALLAMAGAAGAVLSQSQGYAVGDAVEIKSGDRWEKGRVVATTAFRDVFKVRRDGHSALTDTMVRTDQMRRVGAPLQAAARPALVNSEWRMLSAASSGGVVTAEGGYVGLKLWSDGSRWEISSPISYGAGVSLIGQGTFRLTGDRLVMTQRDGKLYGDFIVSWDGPEDARLTYRNRNGVIRLRHVRSFN